MWGRIIALVWSFIFLFKLTAQPDVVAAKLSTVEEQTDFYDAVLNDPLRFYCPNGAQEDVINTIVKGNKLTNIPTLLVTYANGVGKTNIVEHLLANFILTPQNGWFDFSIFQDFSYPKKIWYCSTPDTIKDKFIPEFEKLIAPNHIKQIDYDSAKESKPYVSRYTFKNGWILSNKSYEQSVDKFESDDVGIIINDEPAPDAIRKAQKSRRREGCITINIMTPLYCPPSIYDDVTKAQDEVKEGQKQKMWFLQADVYSACRERGIRGHLKPDVIDDMVSEYDDDEKQARAFGDFMYFSRRIYSTLNRDIHFVDPEEYPIPAYSHIFHVVDPHDSRPSASIWAALTLPVEGDTLGRFIIFDEAPVEKTQPFWDMKRGKSYDEEVKTWTEIETKYKDLEILEFSRILDRHFGWQTRGQTTLAELYWKAGQRIKKNFSFIDSYQSSGKEGEIQVGHKEVRRALKPLSDGKPGLVIWNTCYHTWNGLTHYIRKRETTKTSEDRAPGDGKIVPKYKDFADTARFLVCTRITPDEPEKEMTESEKKWDKVKHPEKYAQEYENDLSWLAN